MFKEVADVQTADMLNLPAPKANYRNNEIFDGEREDEEKPERSRDDRDSR